LESRRKESHAPSVRSSVVNAVRMRPGHWLEFVLCVPISTLTLTIGWQERQLACKKTITLIPKVPFQNRWTGGGVLEGELADPGLAG